MFWYDQSVVPLDIVFCGSNRWAGSSECSQTTLALDANTYRVLILK